jgi:hypothetical protein
MTDQQDEQLECALTELTTWHGPVPQLWRRALNGAKAGRPRTSPRLAWLLHQRLSAPIAAAIIVVALGATIALNLPHLGVKRDARHRSTPAAQAGRDVLRAVVGADLLAESSADEEDDSRTVEQTVEQLASLGYVGTLETGLERYAGREGARLGEGYGARAGSGPGRVATRRFGPAAGDAAGPFPNASFHFSTGAPQEAVAIEPRQIIRKATIELLTDDVRAAFLKATQIVSEAKGEFVQDSSLTGTAESMQADLTLRVAADRLPEVMNELRQLGEVRSEKLAGEDVTTQIVDLEARLRNEQRVEAELLELLEKRQDAPLKEILELRSSLSQVRGVIEQLTAQRERLSRLVSLATVLVIIRTKDAPEPESPSIGSYFIDGVQTAWKKGLMLLSDTCGVLLSVLIGGLIWWVLVAIIFTAILRYRRRHLATATTES